MRLLFWRNMMRAAIARGEALALSEEGVEVLLAARSQRLGRVPAVHKPTPAHNGDLTRLAGTVRGFERDMVLLGKGDRKSVV